VIKVFFYLV